MKTITICKAEPLHDQKPEPVAIIVNSQLPDYRYASLEQAKELYQLEAESIAQALYKSLPQGTFDRLWIELAKIKTTLYRGITND